MGNQEKAFGLESGQCAGTNCTVTNGEGQHSDECIAEHDAAVNAPRIEGKWRYAKTGNVYTVVGECMVKIANGSVWQRAVVYRDDDNDGNEEAYCRDRATFLKKFVPVLTEQQMYEEGRDAAVQERVMDPTKVQLCREGTHSAEAQAMGQQCFCPAGTCSLFKNGLVSADWAARQSQTQIETPPDPETVERALEPSDEGAYEAAKARGDIRFENVDGETTIHGFMENQWWFKALEEVVKDSPNLDAKRAVHGVLKTLLKLISELPKPFPNRLTEADPDPRDVPALAVKRLPGTPRNHASVVDMQTGKVLGHFFLKG